MVMKQWHQVNRILDATRAPSSKFKIQNLEEFGAQNLKPKVQLP